MKHLFHYTKYHNPSSASQIPVFYSEEEKYIILHHLTQPSVSCENELCEYELIESYQEDKENQEIFREFLGTQVLEDLNTLLALKEQEELTWVPAY